MTSAKIFWVYHQWPYGPLRLNNNNRQTTVSCERLELLSSNLVWWCNIISRCVKRKYCFALLKNKVKVRTHYNNNMTVSTACYELLIPLRPNFGLLYITICQGVVWQDWIAKFKVKVTAKVKNTHECPSASFEPLNFVSPNVTYYCINMSWGVMHKDWFPIFRGLFDPSFTHLFKK